MLAFRTLVGLFLSTCLTLACTAGAQAQTPPGALGRLPFLWGVTLAGYQNDGAHPAMDWHAWENEVAKPRGYEASGRGADFRGHMEADLDRAKSIGLNAFRTSIEWSRIEPEEGKVDAQEVAYVHRLLRGIRQRGMAPVITIHHFATPRWFTADRGDGLIGWESPRSVALFRRWATFVAKEFGAEIDWYLTFNEPSNVILGGYATGFIPPHRLGPVAFARATANVLASHEAAYDAIHAADPVARVSVPDYNCQLPVAGGLDWLPGMWFARQLPTVRTWDGRERPRTMDFAAVHYYGLNHTFADFPVTPWHWEGNPGHLVKVLKAYHEAFGLPILIAENGFATREGAAREDGWTRESYMVAHIQAIQQAMAAGVPVIGYMYWTLTDNYEWGSYRPRFGLFEVDVRSGDYTRRPTPAVDVFREIIQAGGVTPALARRFPPPARSTARR